MTPDTIITVLFSAVLLIAADNVRLRLMLKRVNDFNGSRLGRIVNGSTEVVR